MLTYRELDERSSRLSSYFQHTAKVKSGDLVGVMLEPGIDLVCSILGILKSGCTYVPVDFKYPLERKRAIINDSGLNTLFTLSRYSSDLEP